MKEFKIKLENGNTVLVYRSSLRNTVINANDCKTEYQRVGKTDIYKEITNIN